MPKYDDAELAAMKKKEEIAEATRLDDDEESALAEATVEDLMTLAEILGSNPQEFIMEAYADPLKYYEPDPPNTTNPGEAIDRTGNYLATAGLGTRQSRRAQRRRAQVRQRQ